MRDVTIVNMRERIVEYVNFGHTGLKVSRLCLGCMTYGTPKWREWVLDEEASRPFIQRALEAGINFFDTADMYSLGESERVLGNAIRDFVPRDEIVIATKVYNPMGDRPNQRGLAASTSWSRLMPRSSGSAQTTSTCTRFTAGTRDAD